MGLPRLFLEEKWAGAVRAEPQKLLISFLFFFFFSAPRLLLLSLSVSRLAHRLRANPPTFCTARFLVERLDF